MILQDFLLPPSAAEFSELVKKRLADARAAAGTRETVTVEWHDQRIHVDVVDVPLAKLLFNPATHRIRAQREHDPARDKVLSEDPYSNESQAYLKHLLQAEPANPDRRDPAFEDLLESLKEFGQNDPGLITHHGILVNGNTRAAALKEIGAQHMRVGVLPESFTWADINAVELSLQLRKDHRRDYSYINRLLAMEEQASLGRTPEDIAKEFRIRVSTYEQERWILGEIRDLIDRSKSGGGRASLRLIDFEAHQEKLKELHRAYVKKSATDPNGAEVFKEVRLAAVTLGFAKTDVRHIEENFQETYLSRTLPAHLRAAGVGDGAPVVVPGLGVSVSGASPAIATARALNDMILQSKAVAQDTSTGSDEDEQLAAQKTFTELKDVFNDAIDLAGRDARVRKKKQMAPTRLADACASIDLCVVDLVQARASRALDEEAFDDAVIKLRESLRKLAHQAGRGIENPGDGVGWLIDVVALKGTR